MRLCSNSVSVQLRRSLLIVLAVFCLMVSLATRYTMPATSQAHAVNSVSRCVVQPHTQRLNRDAAQWSAPVAVSSFEPAIVLYAHLAPATARFTTRLFEEIPYNRPPPPSSLT